MNFDINILNVEDLFTTRLFLLRSLKKLGYFNVVLEEDGQAALEVLNQKPFDLSYRTSICQIWMFLICLKSLIRTASSDIPFLLITAEKERDKVVEAVAAGIKEYIVKSVKSQSLGNKIKEVVFGAA